MTTQQPIDTHSARVQLTDEERRLMQRFDDDPRPKRGGAKACSQPCKAAKRHSTIVPLLYLIY